MLTCLASLLILHSPLLLAQQSNPWNGRWVAEGTLFQIGVTVTDGVMVIEQIESMGQEWTNEDGAIEGNIASVAVSYAGATGVIQAELISEGLARVFAASCLPDFMVVCVLSKDREAVFRRISE